MSLPLNKDMVSHDLYNGLAENTFRYDGMTITVEKFRMTHFKIEARIWMLPDEGMPASDEDVDFSRFPHPVRLRQRKAAAGRRLGRDIDDETA